MKGEDWKKGFELGTKMKNEAVFKEDHVEILLVHKGEKYYAKIDLEYIELISDYRWYAHKSKYSGFYARSATKGDFISMHQLVLPKKESLYIDHINGDTLDNRRCNLRHATASQNQLNRARMSKRNTSGYRGVYFHKNWKRWSANIWKDGKFTHIGSFGTAKEAAIAYNKATKETHGEFGRLNIIE